MSDNDHNMRSKQDETEPKKDNQEEEASREIEEGKNNEKNNDEEIEDKKNPPFWYFEEMKKEIQDDSIFNDIKENCKYSICVLLKKDDLEQSQELYSTLKGIEQNLKLLKEKIEIESKQIYIFIFVKELYNEYLFNENDVAKLEENIQNKKNQENEENLENKENKENKENVFNLLMRERVFSEDNDLKHIRYFTLALNFGYMLYDISALKAYYSILSKLYCDKLMFSSVITAGVYPTPDSLTILMQSAYSNQKKYGVSVAPIEYKPSNLWSKIGLYERIHFNIYNMSYYNESCAVPISSLLCTMSINKELIDFLNNYYQQKIINNATIDFHDYNLGLNLALEDNRKFFVKFIYNQALGIINKENMSYADYQKQFIDRYSGYYGNFFQICRSFNPSLKAIFLFFQILALVTEFLFPSLCSMVIYTVLLEAFKTRDYRIALFLTSLYLSMMFASGVCSLITKEPQKMTRSNYFLYLFMEFIYALVIVCSVPAMHFANKENDEPNYKFNKSAISLIIIFTFIPYIIPFILYMGVIGNNIVPMIMYLFLGATSSTTIFNVAKVWNAPDTAGGNKLDYRKSILITFYLGSNLFVGGTSFYMNGRKKRANCLMVLGIIFLIYNFVRTLAVLIKFLCHNEKHAFQDKLLNKIKNKLNGVEVDEKEVDDKVEKNNENIQENDNNDGNENNEENENNGENGDGNNEEEKNDDENNNNTNENNNNEEG